MAKSRKKRNQIKQQAANQKNRDSINVVSVKDEKQNVNVKNLNQKVVNENKDIKQTTKKDEKNVENSNKSFKEKFVHILANKHVPIIGRIYKTFFIYRKNKDDSNEYKKNLLILFGGLFFMILALAIAILSLTGVIVVNIDGSGTEFFSAGALAIFVILGILV